MAAPKESDIKPIHAEYCQLVGDILLTFDRMYWWGQWLARGWTVAELRLVVAYLQKEIARGNRYPGSLRWSRLIQQTDNFDEELVLARGSMKRKVPETPLGRAMQQLRPVVAHVTPNAAASTAVSAKDLIANLKRAAGMPA